MSKITSWDGLSHGGYVYSADTPYEHIKRDGKPCRVKVWPEGAPDPSTVPHAGEKVKFDGRGLYEVKHGIPEKSGGGTWCLRTTDNVLRCVNRMKRITDSPTIELPNGKKYRADDVIARCAELEEL